ncbi:uncharacterized protein LOC122004322 [Zingiber officinale]|uniref:uncharacterized protein LOC122004322 n=1 Tax=Zingiber officinale TaxID=94328 RepID=UPI001C4CBA8D|nr:uncharacterized protein LOC122004322 [Zingiber officinale]
MSAFSHGLTEGEFFRDLIRNPVKNFDEMLEKATNYINVEEAQAARRKIDKPPPINKPERRVPQPPAQPLPRAREARPTFHPGQNVRPIPHVAAVHAPRPGSQGPRYCTYHRSHTHATSNCFQFARDSCRATELGLPPPQASSSGPKNDGGATQCSGTGQPTPGRSGGPSMQQQGHAGEQGEAHEAENRGNVAIRDIGMISGGPTDGDSGRARKSHERRLEIHVVGCSQEQAAGPVISFGPQDLEGLELPHDDALIIKAIIANSRVARVFVDTGSSINVLFRTAFEEM